MATVTVKWSGNPPCGADSTPYVGETYSLYLNQTFFSTDVTAAIEGTFVSEGPGGTGYDRTYTFTFDDTAIPSGFTALDSCHIKSVACVSSCCEELQRQINAIKTVVGSTVNVVDPNVDNAITGSNTAGAFLSKNIDEDIYNKNLVAEVDEPQMVTMLPGSNDINNLRRATYDSINNVFRYCGDVVFVANRADGRDGTGASPADPRHVPDAATFDALVASRANNPTNWIYMTDVETEGASGADSTLYANHIHDLNGNTIKLVTASEEDKKIFYNPYVAETPRGVIEIKNGTLDCNWQPGTNAQRGGITCHAAKNFRGTNLKCINFGQGQIGQRETFVLACTFEYDTEEAYFENCIVTDGAAGPHSEGVTGFLVSPGQLNNGPLQREFTPQQKIGVYGCQVIDEPGNKFGYAVYQNAFTSPVVDGCYAKAQRGAYCEFASPDLGASSGDTMLVRNCVFEAFENGVYSTQFAGNDPYYGGNLIVQNCLFNYDDAQGPTNLGIRAFSDSNVAGKRLNTIVIQDNILRFREGRRLAQAGLENGITLNNAEHASVYNNKIHIYEPGVAATMSMNILAGVQNQDLYGNTSIGGDATY